MKATIETIKKKLDSVIRDIVQTAWLYAREPLKDFTRNRKLPLGGLLRLLLTMGGNSLPKELISAFDYSVQTPTVSAFVQQRNKLLPEACEYLFHAFTDIAANTDTHCGYRILAVDGSDVRCPANPNWEECYFENRPGTRGFNMIHLNALYDIVNKVYLDAIIQGKREWNEHDALVRMTDRSTISGRAIVLADRGYESYNNMAHIEKKGWFYLIRLKEGARGILSAVEKPSTPQFDITIHRRLTRRQTKVEKSMPELYHYLIGDCRFDFLNDRSQDYYPMTFRIVRFEISDGVYESVITNLDPHSFSHNQIKQLYEMRWGIETSFRTLKYNIGMIAFHTKQPDGIKQEIFAALTMYNVAQLILATVYIPEKDTAYLYVPNIAAGIFICKQYLSKPNALAPPTVEALLLKNILPVRKGRVFERNIHPRHAVAFDYRIA